MNRVVGLIPARLQSQRLPRKALIDICGLPMIVHTYLRACRAKTLDAVYVVTDSLEIRDIVHAHGGKTLLTHSNHQTGTDRIAEAVTQLDCEIAVNIQGDEALVDPHAIDRVVGLLLNDPAIEVALLVNPFARYNSPSDIKVVLNEKNEVMYLSRADIPSSARTSEPPMLKAYHIVPFRKEFLIEYSQWPKGTLETIEFNEYLRILEKGRKIHAVSVQSVAVSVDTEEDLVYVRGRMEQDSLFSQYRSAPIRVDADRR